MKSKRTATCGRRVHVALAVALSLFSRAIHAQEADSASLELRNRIRTSSPWLREHRAALELAFARAAATSLPSPATLEIDVEEVPGLANVVSAGSIRAGLSRELLPRQIRHAARAVAQVEVTRAREELELAERASDLWVDQLVTASAAYAAIAARFASEDSVLLGAEEALRARFAVADARYVDVLRLRTERLRVETELQRARFEHAARMRQLVQLEGNDTLAIRRLVAAAVARRAAQLAQTIPTPPPLDSLIAGSGVIRLAELEVERARLARTLVGAEQRMRIAPALGFQRFGDADRGHSFGLTAGVSLSLPFTATGSRAAYARVADREVAYAEARLDASRATLRRSLTQARDRYDLARVQVASFDAAMLRGLRGDFLSAR